MGHISINHHTNFYFKKSVVFDILEEQSGSGTGGWYICNKGKIGDKRQRHAWPRSVLISVSFAVEPAV